VDELPDLPEREISDKPHVIPVLENKAEVGDDVSLEEGQDTSSLDRRVWGPWATAGFGLVVGIVDLIIQLLIVGVFFAVNLASDPTLNPVQLAEKLITNGLVLSISTFATTIVCVGLIIVIVKVRRSATIVDYLGLRPITRKTILVLLAISAGIIILSDCLTLILGKPLSPEFMVDAYNSITWPVLLWIAVVIFAPASEEIFFRGFLFTGFSQSRIRVTGTIAITALIWTLLHLGQYDVYGLATVFVLGIVLGIVRFRTGSLWSPLLMHAFFNLIATFEVALNVNGLVS